MLTSILALCCLITFVGDKKKEEDKRPDDIRDRLVEIDKMFREAFPKVGAAKTSAKREKATEETIEAFEKWAKEHDGEVWKTSAIVNDVHKRKSPEGEESFEIEVSAPLPLSDFTPRASSKPVDAENTLKFKITSDQEEVLSPKDTVFLEIRVQTISAKPKDRMPQGRLFSILLSSSLLASKGSMSVVGTPHRIHVIADKIEITGHEAFKGSK